MEAVGVQKLYEPSPTPILHVGPAAKVMGNVPFMPLFLSGNSTPTIPHQPRHLPAHMGMCALAASASPYGNGQMQPRRRARWEATATR